MNVLIVTGLSGAGKTRALQILEDMGYYCVRVLFLDCSEEVLLKRYKESRRLHPLMSGNRNVNLTDAIRQEISRMECLKVEADFVVDTSELSTSRLRAMLPDQYSGPDTSWMRNEFLAFGYM